MGGTPRIVGLSKITFMALACAGIPVQTGVHRDAGAASGDDRRFLANVVGEQLDHRGYVDQTARTGSGQYLDQRFICVSFSVISTRGLYRPL